MNDSSQNELQDLRQRLEDAEETLRAIRAGEVDALIVDGVEGEQVYTLQGADLPYRTLIEEMHQGAVSLSSDGAILYCNRSFSRMLKQPQEKVVGAAVADFLSESQQDRFQAMLAAGRTQSIQNDLQFQTADGKTLSVYLSIAPLPLSDNVAMCMVVTDLTEQNKHRTIRESNQRKDEFLAMLAHELRNPLAPIRSGLDVLAMVGGGQEETIELMRGQVNHLVRLVDDLLDVSRIVRGRVDLRREPVEAASLVRQSVDALRGILQTRNQELVISLPDEPLWLDADAVRLNQVIGNLLNNASKYTDQGGHIEITLQRQGEQLLIRVTDNGMGIDAELLPKVFELFVQSSRSLDRSQGGLGIGLTLVKNLVEMHGGTVAAHSEGSGNGSRFEVRLPLAEAPREVEEPPQPAAAQGALRVLVVDDNLGAVKILTILISRLGSHVIETAHDGEAALEKATQFRPDLILLDIGLPKMDGFTVARKIRENGDLERTLLVALTGYGQEEDRQKSKEAGFDVHLVKPVDVATLRELLQSCQSARGSC
ncbi:hybrid sensor histidine kinase/response regulator [Lignipirellula cremea]|uniref:histidine kinase n=1 Tax=Lignipirellula cremea TaxID=2528010 RepID=A0A518E105_9BACT|nr:ATP-binding protein [Lignipirellula cremea]QDU97775.1 Autoinducer 2 sensor kinase/phosphatase LuxQ [Lignipirellula cremea]